VTYIKNDDKVYYLACPEDSCRRKVIENDGVVDQNGRFRCETCNRSYNTCVPSYMLLAKISDFSDSVFVNFYR
jgi:transposase-like protein